MALLDRGAPRHRRGPLHHQYAPKWLQSRRRPLVDLLAAVPVDHLRPVGPAGLRTATPRHAELPARERSAGSRCSKSPTVGSFTTIFLAGIVLAIMILPIITALSREVFAQTPTTHKEGALALGATKWEMIRTAVLPFGKPGVISAAMLGLGRALGETVAVMILISSLAPGTPSGFSFFDGGETFASKIALGAGEFDTPQKTGAYIAAGLVLFILTFVVNAIARIVIERRKAFTE
jgi:phosphate transport system permease protein